MLGNLMFYSILALLIVGLVLYIIGLYNTVVRLAALIDRNFANLESFLKQRHDEIPKLVNACQAYMQHERDTLRELVELRTAYGQAADSETKIGIENKLNETLGRIHVAVESYPELKASDSFQHAMQRFSGLESSINDQRLLFNDAVTQYNVCIRQFPALLVAGAIGATARSLLRIPEEQQADFRNPFPLADSPRQG